MNKGPEVLLWTSDAMYMATEMLVNIDSGLVTDGANSLLYSFITHCPFLRTLIKIRNISFKKIHYKMSSVKWRPLCFGLNVLPVSHRSLVDSPHKGQWRGALRFPLMCARTNSWANNRHAADLRRHRAHCNIIVMWFHGTGKMPRLLYRREVT